MIETFSALHSDIRLSFRSLWRSKVLTLAVVTTLALGIGANAAMFTLVRGVLLRPLVNREENRLIFDVALEDGSPHVKVALSLTPLRKVIKDYFLICESYYKAIRTAPPSQIEALDMGRRGLHNEGAGELQKRLEGRIETDFDTARRLFTLICVLQIRG